ncbi:hypothetical protein DCS_05730 [Drechmeria coniospora]|uniref:INO80 chromatin remodeling complex Ies1 n=1 Tax=Drechmeria coniospora TaxID=98403 RepID=A0A151GNM5_DRECN|nr:hypothetical protein DCS_05730 [Drechmeria coniospora]KYK58713.1 hypothetical protein DCS_05730 [Drechmeria coniospora]
MTASPRSEAAASDDESRSSPAAADGKSLVSRTAADDDDTQMAADDEPEATSEKPARGKGKGSQAKDVNGSHLVGKIRHLKKEDGEPLWREDIQYDFLRAVFDDERKVFTNSYDAELGKQTFADLYIDTMSRSSKTSKVLRDKLLSDREAAKGMAMVCLLVNVGRMNTTLNCRSPAPPPPSPLPSLRRRRAEARRLPTDAEPVFPEMRAQLRTYHAIPSLQAQQDPHAYKQLQDAPRLKSILKGGAEDRPEPGSLDKIKHLESAPRTNPVNLIFVMCNGAQKIAELHFPEDQEFHDLIMKTNCTSASRAGAFLWLMWFYLESDFTEEGCEENPFGAGVDYGLDVANQGVPRLELMTEEEMALENVDTADEIEFGREKQKTRAKILELDQAYLNERETKRQKLRPPISDDGPAILPRIRPSKHESDVDSTRSTPPPRPLGRGGASSRRGLPLKYQIFEGSSPARHGSEGVVARKPRPPTAHQLAVERNRNERVEYILDRGLRRQHHKGRKARRQEGAIFRAYRRIQASDDPFDDSDDEDGPRNLVANVDKAAATFRETGIGGLCLLKAEEDDYGEEVSSYAAALRRATRRMARWRGREDKLGVVAPVKKRKLDDEAKAGDTPNKPNGDVAMGEAEADDADQTVTVHEDGDQGEGEGDGDGNGDGNRHGERNGEGNGEGEGEGEEDADDADKTEVMGDSDLD